MKTGPFKMKGKSPMMKALIGDQKNLNDGLKAAIQDSPATMKKESPAKQGKMSLTYTKTNKKTGKTTTNANSGGVFNRPGPLESDNSLVAKETPDGNFMKNYKPPIFTVPEMNKLRPPIGLPGKDARNNLKPAVGKMKKESMAKMNKKSSMKMNKKSMAKMKKSPAKAGQTAGQIMRRERLMN